MLLVITSMSSMTALRSAQSHVVSRMFDIRFTNDAGGDNAHPKHLLDSVIMPRRTYPIILVAKEEVPSMNLTERSDLKKWLEIMPDANTTLKCGQNETIMVFIMTFYPHHKTLCYTLESALRFGIQPVLAGYLSPWKGWGSKPKILGGILKHFHDSCVVIFQDAVDETIVAPLSHFSEAFQDFPQDSIVFAAECYCAPANHPICKNATLYPLSPTPQRFLNAGQLMGPVWRLRELIDDMFKMPQFSMTVGDQDFHSLLYQRGKNHIVLDHYNKLFLSMHVDMDQNCMPYRNLALVDGWWTNAKTGLCCCCFCSLLSSYSSCSLTRATKMTKYAGGRPGAFHYNGPYAKKLSYLIEQKMWWRDPEFREGWVNDTLHQAKIIITDDESNVVKWTTFSHVCPSHK